MPTHTLPPDVPQRRPPEPPLKPPPGFRDEDLIVNGVPDTKEMIERSFNKQARWAFEEFMKLRQRRGGE